MKLLQLTNKPPWPAKDGGAIGVMNHTRRFSELGHDVTVLSMKTLKHTADMNEIPLEIREKVDFHFVDVPAEISPWKALINLIFSRKPYNGIRFISDNYKATLKNLLTANHFDIVQLEGLYMCPYIPLIRQNSKAAIVYRSHNIEYEIWERTAAVSRGIKKWYLRNLAHRIQRFEQSVINQYDWTVTVTQRDADMLKKMGNNKPLLVSPTGTDVKTMTSTMQQIEFPSLFHLGSLEWAPNQEGVMWFIAHCWPQIHEKFPSLIFYIAGRNAPEWLIKKFAVKGIKFLGEVDDARAFMSSKAIMVVPLLSGSGMRVKIVEGMALGKAIVSTTIGAEGIDIEHGKNILTANAPNDFVEQISSLIEDKELFEKISRNAIHFINEYFDDKILAKKLLEFYKKQLL